MIKLFDILSGTNANLNLNNLKLNEDQKLLTEDRYWNSYRHPFEVVQSPSELISLYKGISVNIGKESLGPVKFFSPYIIKLKYNKNISTDSTNLGRFELASIKSLISEEENVNQNSKASYGDVATDILNTFNGAIVKLENVINGSIDKKAASASKGKATKLKKIISALGLMKNDTVLSVEFIKSPYDNQPVQAYISLQGLQSVSVNPDTKLLNVANLNLNEYKEILNKFKNALNNLLVTKKYKIVANVVAFYRHLNNKFNVNKDNKTYNTELTQALTQINITMYINGEDITYTLFEWIQTYMNPMPAKNTLLSIDTIKNLYIVNGKYVISKEIIEKNNHTQELVIKSIITYLATALLGDVFVRTASVNLSNKKIKNTINNPFIVDIKENGTLEIDFSNIKGYEKYGKLDIISKVFIENEGLSAFYPNFRGERK